MNTTFQQTTLTLEAAHSLIANAIKEAERLSMKISVCVLDSSGRIKAFSSMDQAPAVSLEACIKKAKTAVGFGLPTGKTWYEFIKNDPILMNGAEHLPDFILLGGGSPVMVNGALAGAIGVSGGHYEQDEKCVNAALAALPQQKA